LVFTKEAVGFLFLLLPKDNKGLFIAKDNKEQQPKKNNWYTHARSFFIKGTHHFLFPKNFLASLYIKASVS
jgi:hypothetical protein